MGKTNKIESKVEEKLYEPHHVLPVFSQVLRQHIMSYDHLISIELKQILLSQSNRQVRSEIIPDFFLQYDNVYLTPPTLSYESVKRPTTPNECRLRNLTYSSQLLVDVRYTKQLGEKLVLRKRVGVEIGRIPVMVRSKKCVLNGKSEADRVKLGECGFDPGGYFIVKGKEKVVQIQEQQSKNKILLQKDKTGSYFCDVQSTTHESKSRTYLLIKKDKLYVKHNSFIQDLPLLLVLTAMHSIPQSKLYVGLLPEGVAHCNVVSNSFEDIAELGIVTQLHALQVISTLVKKYQPSQPNKTPDEVLGMLGASMVTHIPMKDFDFRPRVEYLCLMTRSLLKAHINQDDSLLDDKDYYGNKRLELAGNLLSFLFEDTFKRFNSELLKVTDKTLQKLTKNRRNVALDGFDMCSKLSRGGIITQGFEYAISSGNWTLKRFRMERKGVTQQLNRMSYISSLGHLTRVTSNFEKTRKVSGPRALHPSQWGLICVADTPEGEACGLVKNLAWLSHVTQEAESSESQTIKNFVLTLGTIPSLIRGMGGFTVEMDGTVLGMHLRPHWLVKKLRQLRRKGLITPFASLLADQTKNRVLITCDGGRVCRPLIIVNEKTQKSNLTLEHINRIREIQQTLPSETLDAQYEKIRKYFLSHGVIEYIDVNESNNTLIAVTPEDLAKKQPGFKKLAANSLRSVLDFPVVAPYTHLEIDPSSILGVVSSLIPFPNHNQSPRNTYQCAMGKQSMGAVCHTQFHRFDTLMYGLAYPQKPLVSSRGLSRVRFDQMPSGHNAIIAVMSFTGYDIEDAIILNKASLDRGFGRCMLLKAFQTKHETEDPFIPGTAKSKIDKDGIIKPSARVNAFSTLVNKEGSSLKFPGGRGGAVQKVLITSSDTEGFIVKVLVRDIRRPELGDKFSSRHGQKGVVGLIVPEEDMPVSDAGIRPDLVMNPHGFPSRMTVGKMLELLGGKSGLMDGKTKDGTAFDGDRYEVMSEVLRKSGYNYCGKDVMTSGETGETLQAYVYMGPVYYQKLKHMVVDKMHARQRGPKAQLTRQPTEGRSKQGGLRVGEMEKDCLVGYGASALLNERLMLSSDVFEATFCTICGKLAQPFNCRLCRSKEGLTKMKIPYACKLLFQELEAMNIVPRVQFGPC